MARRLDRDTIIGLPKAQLHLHLEAAMRPATAAELAERYGRPAPQAGPYDGLRGFVEAYESARDLLVTLEDVARVAAELVEDAGAQGIGWSEVHCVPFNYNGRLGAPEGVVESVLDGLRQGAAASGVQAALILAHNRADDPELAWKTLDLARDRVDAGVVGFGLVGNEADFPPAPYAEVFKAARERGLLSVPHAGEAAGPESIRSAWRDLDANRIGHGVRAVEDPALLAELAVAGVCLDVCPTSNAMLHACPSLPEHQLPALLAADVTVSLGSDGPLFFGVDVVDEYLTAHRVLGLAADQLARIARNSLHHSAAPEQLKATGYETIDAWQLNVEAEENPSSSPR